MTADRSRIGCIFVCTILTLGCDATSRPVTSPASEHEGGQQPPIALPRAIKPDAYRLHYDVKLSQLKLYSLQEPNARWLLITPEKPHGVPIDGEVTFSQFKGVDLDRISVVITMPNHRPSPAVSLREIVDLRTSTAQR